MLRKLFLLTLLVALPAGAQEYSNSTLRASVSPEFISGLHRKYLEYLAVKLNRELVILPMSFARRVKALRMGELDIMVGLQHGHNPNDEFIYIQPPYERLRHAFFVLASEQHRLQRFEQLGELSIGITRHAQYFDRFSGATDLALVEVSSLAQKVGLLRKGRIDTFLHFEHSAHPYLKRMAWEQEVVLAPYQPAQFKDYFVAISARSPIILVQSVITQVVIDGVEAGDFARIRQAHYGTQ